MSNSQIEIISARERRRRWSVEEKLRIVAESHEPGDSVRAVAAKHDVYPNLLRTWQRLVRQGRLSAITFFFEPFDIIHVHCYTDTRLVAVWGEVFQPQGLD